MHALPASCLLCGQPTLATPLQDGEWLCFHCGNPDCGPSKVLCEAFSEIAASPRRDAWREIARACRGEGRMPCIYRTPAGRLDVRYVAPLGLASSTR
jgi:hypothetical protein